MTYAARARLVVLVSGRGRNLQAIHAACVDGRIDARLAAVISNRAGVPALDYAHGVGVEAVTLRHEAFRDRYAFDQALTEVIDRYRPDIVAMAGFMRIVGAPLVAHYRGRLLNIHPALLPRYPGLDTHRRALVAGDAEHGATVHFVTEQLDGGPAVIQAAVSIRADDDAETLAERVMRQVESKIYPQALAWMARGELQLDAAGIRFRGRRLAAPLGAVDLEAAFR